MKNQQGAPEALIDPSPDQLRAIARTARNSSGSASDDCGPLAYVLHGWRAAAIASRAQQAALVEAQQPAKAESLRQILTDPENQPNQYGVQFLMHGAKMAFRIGNRQFCLDYEPDEPGEFEFMRDALISAFSIFTPDVKLAQQPATHVQNPAEIEHVAGDVSKNGPKSNMAQQPAPSEQQPFGWIKQSEIDSSNDFGGSINLWRQKYDCDVPVYLAQQPAPSAADTATVPEGWTDADADAARLALELECLLTDTKDQAVVSKWWASAHDALELHRARLAAPQPAPTPQADSQPASDPADIIAGALQTSRGHAMELMQQAVDADRAARAPAQVATNYKQALGSTNCMQCCVSYMFGVPMESVPDFATGGGWERFSAFAESKGYAAVMIPGNLEFEADYLASGKTERGTSHMVVMNDGKLVHDPHPSNAGLTEVQCVWLLAKKATPQRDDRGAFEACAKSYTSNVSFERDGNDYEDMTASLLWHGWKLRAARAPADGVLEDAARLEQIAEAIRDYHHALDMRKHGGLAESAAFSSICNTMGMHWNRGEEAARRAARKQGGA